MKLSRKLHCVRGKEIWNDHHTKVLDDAFPETQLDQLAPSPPHEKFYCLDVAYNCIIYNATAIGCKPDELHFCGVSLVYKLQMNILPFSFVSDVELAALYTEDLLRYEIYFNRYFNPWNVGNIHDNVYNPDGNINLLTSNSLQCSYRELSEISEYNRDEKTLINISSNIHSLPKHYEELLFKFGLLMIMRHSLN